MRLPRRAPGHDVGDVDLRAVEPDRAEHAVEQLARTPREGPALPVLLGARRLADRHDPARGIAVREGEARRRVLQAAALEGFEHGLQLVEAAGLGGGLAGRARRELRRQRRRPPDERRRGESGETGHRETGRGPARRLGGGLGAAGPRRPRPRRSGRAARRRPRCRRPCRRTSAAALRVRRGWRRRGSWASLRTVRASFGSRDGPPRAVRQPGRRCGFTGRDHRGGRHAGALGSKGPHSRWC